MGGMEVMAATGANHREEGGIHKHPMTTGIRRTSPATHPLARLLCPRSQAPLQSGTREVGIDTGAPAERECR